MNDFLNKLSQKGKEFAEKAADFADKAVDVGGDLLEKGKDKAEDLFEKGKDKTEELKLKGALRDVYVKIGELVYDQKVNGSTIDGVDALVAKVTGIKEELKALEEKAAARAAEEAAAKAAAQEVEDDIICPVCGVPMPAGTEYCTICGAKMTE